MKNSAKTRLMIAFLLVALGLFVFTGVMFVYDWDFSRLNTVAYETNTCEIIESFDRISILADTTEITFAPSDDESCSIICHEPEKIRHSAAVQDGQLTINTLDTRKWYDHIGISLNSPEMTIYLPGDKYADVFIETDTGDIRIPKDFSIGSLEIAADTADVDCHASVSEEVKIETDTGDIKLDEISAGRLSLSANTGDVALNSVTAKGNVEIESNTGRIKLTDVLCADLQAASDTGDINLENTVASGRFSIESDTGDVHFDSSDAHDIFVETNTGDVKGNLRSDKLFVAESDTGSINVPETMNGGRCQIITDTGDIKLAIEK